MNYSSKRLFIHPENQNDINYWTKKWGVSVKQINDAIIETGSINSNEIKTVLIEKGELGKISFYVRNIFKKMFNSNKKQLIH